MWKHWLDQSILRPKAKPLHVLSTQIIWDIYFHHPSLSPNPVSWYECDILLNPAAAADRGHGFFLLSQSEFHCSRSCKASRMSASTVRTRAGHPVLFCSWLICHPIIQTKCVVILFKQITKSKHDSLGTQRWLIAQIRNYLNNEIFQLL